MPGLPLVVHETTALGCSCSHSRTTDEMCRQQSRVCLTAEEALAAEESLSIYCKPVELYNILQRRAIRNPSFLQRCLHYKIQAKRKQRIQLTVSLYGSINAEIQPRNMFPLYVLLGRPTADVTAVEKSPVYRVLRACLLTKFGESGKGDEAEANFIISDFKKLSCDTHVGNFTIILLSYGETRGLSAENHLPKGQEELAPFLAKLGGNCFWGKLQIDSLCSSLEKCVSLSLGHRTEMLSTINMQSSLAEPSSLDQGNCLAFRGHTLDSIGSYQVQVSICAQEIGAKDRSPYDSYTYDDVPTTSLSHIIRLRTGNVLFNYRYYNNTLQKTEVTEDFSCPFCLVRCASFKGLRYHLTSSHDLFNFEFWVTEEYQAVNVSVRTDIWKSEVISDGVDPRLQTFSYRSKFKRRRRSKNIFHNVKNVHPHVVESDLLQAREGFHEDNRRNHTGMYSVCRLVTSSADAELSNVLNSKEEEKTRGSFDELHLLSTRHKSESYCSENNHTSNYIEPVASSPETVGGCTATAQASTSNECALPVSESNLAAPTMLQFAKTRKLSIERPDPRNRALLQKRQFFHSHRAQPMALDQVVSDRDSEDEVDDDIADFEDRRMLDDFVDVTKDEKQIMHLWNSFVRKQRVLADGHITWACEAFSQLHGQDLVQAPALLWCWRLFMIKLWNHSLLDARTMNNCNIILERFQTESLDPKQG